MDIFTSAQSDTFTGFRETSQHSPSQSLPYKDHFSEETHTKPRLMPAEGAAYAGDVSAAEAYEVLASEDDAVLVDVRTKAEWTFVGIPDLSALGKSAALVEWISFPSMGQNKAFLSDLERLVPGAREKAVFFMCRSGGRSRNAAIAAAAHGFTRAYNIDSGFEGPLDGDRHRGGVNGWKATGLPWAQS